MGLFKKKKKESDFKEKLKIAVLTDGLNNQGTIEFNNGNIEKAITLFNKALKVMPSNDDALINIGACFKEMGNYPEAINCCEKAIAIDPDRSDGYRMIGDVYYKIGDLQQVIKWYRSSAKRGDTSTSNWLSNNGFL